MREDLKHLEYTSIMGVEGKNPKLAKKMYIRRRHLNKYRVFERNCHTEKFPFFVNSSMKLFYCLSR